MCIACRSWLLAAWAVGYEHMSAPKKQSVPIDAMATAFAGLAKGGKVSIQSGDGIPGPVPARSGVPSSASDEPFAPSFRPHAQFTLTSYSKQFSLGAEYLTFGIAELEPAQEAKALDLGGKSPAAVMREMVKMSIVRIGNKADPDYAFVESWLKAIGSKGRKLVDMAYMSENLASDDEGEAFLATKVPQYG